MATVTVAPGTVVNETIATFTNATRLGAFKICTGQTSPGAALAGVVFPYLWSYTSNGVTSSGTVHLAVQTLGQTCSAISASIPVVNTDGTPVVVSVTAQAPSVLSVDLAVLPLPGRRIGDHPAEDPGGVPADGDVLARGRREHHDASPTARRTERLPVGEPSRPGQPVAR